MITCQAYETNSLIILINKNFEGVSRIGMQKARGMNVLFNRNLLNCGNSVK